jgi:AraC-like DNA-binding protein
MARLAANEDGLVVRYGIVPERPMPAFARDVNLDVTESDPRRAQPLDESGSAKHTLACCCAGTGVGPTRLQLHAHQGLEVGLLLAGREEHHCGSLRLIHGPGDVWLYGPWEPHGWRAGSPEATKVVVIFLPEYLGEDPLGPAPYLHLFALPADRRLGVSNSALRRSVLAIGRQMAREIEEQSSFWTHLLRLHLLRLLAELARAWDNPEMVHNSMATRTSGNALARIIPAVSLVQTHPQRRVSGPQAAAACNLSLSRFYHVFRGTMGISFGAFALRARVSFAAQHLLHTDETLREIAERAGFSDISHLHRAFVRHYGCTPGEYRAQVT